MIENVISFAVNLAPLIPDGIALAIGLAGAFKYVKDKQWYKLRAEIEKQSIPLMSELIHKEQKRDLVVRALYRVMPKWFKLAVTEDQVDQYVDLIYQTQVKPKVERETEIYGQAKAGDDDHIRVIM